MAKLFLAPEFKKVSRGGAEAQRVKIVGDMVDMKDLALFLSANSAPLRE